MKGEGKTEICGVILLVPAALLFPPEVPMSRR
jgi:hypothetical protein